MSSVFAERQYVLRDTNGSESNVILKIHVPRPTDHSDWMCDFEIIRNDSVRTRFHAIGEDCVQALLLAFRMAEATLNALARDRNAKLRWLDDEDSDLHLRT